MTNRPQASPAENPNQPTPESVISTICGETIEILESCHNDAFTDMRGQMFESCVLHDMEVDSVWLNMPASKRIRDLTPDGPEFQAPFDLIAFHRPTEFARTVASLRFGDHPDFDELPQFLINLISTEDRTQDITLALFEDKLVRAAEDQPWVNVAESARRYLGVVKNYGNYGEILLPEYAHAALEITDPFIGAGSELQAEVIDFLRNENDPLPNSNDNGDDYGDPRVA